MSRRHRRVGVLIAALALSSFLAATAAPAAAVVDHEAAVLDLQRDGFVPAPPEVEGIGRITEEGELAPPGYMPPEGSSFIGGYMKTWISLHSGHAIVILAGEFQSVAMATIDKNRTVSEASFRDAGELTSGPTPFGVPGIPDAVGASGTIVDEGYALGAHVVAFTKGTMSYTVGAFAPEGEMDPSTVLDVAAQQYAFGPTVEPVAAVDGPDAGPRESAAYRAGQAFGALILVGGVVALLGLVVFLVVRSARGKKPRQMPGPPPGWSLQSQRQPVGYAPPPPSTPQPVGAMQWSGPQPNGGWEQPAPAPAPAASPASWTHPDAGSAPSPAPTSATERVSRPCPSCGDDFGTAAACDHCGAARTFCVVCDTKIWAGALTCVAHAS